MLANLINQVHCGLLHYIKLVEKEHYKGDNVFSLAYVEQSKNISAKRKANIKDIIKFCEQAQRELQTPKQLATNIFTYMLTINGKMGEWFHQLSRLQIALVQAITHYYPEFIKWEGSKIAFNLLAADFLPENPVEANALAPQLISVQQVQQLLNMMTQLKQINQKLHDREEKQEERFKQQEQVNLQLRQSLAQTQLQLLQFKQQTQGLVTPGTSPQLPAPYIKLDHLLAMAPE